MLLFSDSKETLREWQQAAEEQLGQLRLTIHAGAHPRPVTEGFPFLGFVVFPTHRRVKRRKVIQYRRALKRLLRAYEEDKDTLPAERVVASILGWINHVRYGDTWGLRRAVLGQVVL